MTLEFAQLRLDDTLGVWALAVCGGLSPVQPHCTYPSEGVATKESLETAQNLLQTWGYRLAALSWAHIDGCRLVPVCRAADSGR